MDDFEHRIPPWAITLILHNWPVMVGAAGIIIAAVRAFLRPSRAAVLLLYGFLLLVFAFEYEKHGLPAVRGTLDYVFARALNVRDVGALLLLEVLPVLLYLLGASSLIVSLAISRRPPGSDAGPTQ